MPHLQQSTAPRHAQTSPSKTSLRCHTAFVVRGERGGRRTGRRLRAASPQRGSVCAQGRSSCVSVGHREGAAEAGRLRVAVRAEDARRLGVAKVGGRAVRRKVCGDGVWLRARRRRAPRRARSQQSRPARSDDQWARRADGQQASCQSRFGNEPVPARQLSALVTLDGEHRAERLLSNLVSLRMQAASPARAEFTTQPRRPLVGSSKRYWND